MPRAPLGLGMSFLSSALVLLLYPAPLRVILSLGAVIILAMCDGAEMA